MALDSHIVAVNHMEFGAHRFIVGDTLRVTAFDNTYNGVGENDGKFLDHFIITDDVDHSRRSYQGDTVEGFLGKKDIGHLNNPFLTQLLAIEIVTDSHSSIKVFDAKYLDSLEEGAGRDMVNNSTALESGYSQFLLGDGHIMKSEW